VKIKEQLINGSCNSVTGDTLKRKNNEEEGEEKKCKIIREGKESMGIKQSRVGNDNDVFLPQGIIFSPR
jgi:hypothetical protein